MTSFQTIRARAEKRKGGAEALARLMPPAPDPKALRKLTDDRVLAEMAKRVFSAGFAWSVIESKWPSFEDAFLGFEPSRLAFEPDEFWHLRSRSDCSWMPEQLCRRWCWSLQPEQLRHAR